MKRIFPIALVTVVLIGIGAWILFDAKTDVAAAIGVDENDVKGAVALLEAGTEDRDRFRASIDGTSLNLTADGETLAIPLPEGEFYLSVAPYKTSTHECTIHSLVTCRGEMKNETFQVTVLDADGATILSGEYAAGENGFFGLWLPAGISGTIVVSHGGHAATGVFTTDASSPTCMTTLELS